MTRIRIHIRSNALLCWIFDPGWDQNDHIIGIGTAITSHEQMPIQNKGSAFHCMFCLDSCFNERMPIASPFMEGCEDSFACTCKKWLVRLFNLPNVASSMGIQIKSKRRYWSRSYVLIPIFGFCLRCCRGFRRLPDHESWIQASLPWPAGNLEHQSSPYSGNWLHPKHEKTPNASLMVEADFVSHLLCGSRPEAHETTRPLPRHLWSFPGTSGAAVEGDHCPAHHAPSASTSQWLPPTATSPPWRYAYHPPHDCQSWKWMNERATMR